jgi:hypothetical protein
MVVSAGQGFIRLVISPAGQEATDTLLEEWPISPQRYKRKGGIAYLLMETLKADFLGQI